MAHCTGCGRPVIWLPNAKTGRQAPVDPDPIPTGNVVIEGAAADRTYRVLTKREIGETAASLFEQPRDRYTLHFATCPKASHFRRCAKCHRSPCGCDTPLVPR